MKVLVYLSSRACISPHQLLFKVKHLLIEELLQEFRLPLLSGKVKLSHEDDNEYKGGEEVK